MSRRLARLATAAALAAASCSTSSPTPDERVAPPKTPTKGDVVADFAVDAVYQDDKGGTVGTRWVHRGHGMPVVVLHIQSVPQVFLAFNTPPIADRGEPHAGEHLLLGKGTKGRMLALEEGMSLVESTAWTAQTDVCYSWSCAAGKDTFYRSVARYLDALLMPDYSDEEIRREVCHVGPVKDEQTGKLSLDEKGTVYQEMVSTSAKRWNVWDEMQKRLWGEGHPLSWNSGGTPEALRTVTAKDIRAFHEPRYHLGPDTQMIVALPDSIPETDFLTTLSAQMAAVDARPEMKNRGKVVHAIPPGRPQADRSPKTYPYPNSNEDDGGSTLVMWTPVRLGALEDRMFCELLLSTLANGDTATLYKRLMDGATREVVVDASSMGGSLDASKIDLLPYVSFDGVPARNATPENLAKITKVIRDEIARVASLAPGSAELKAFNEKALVKATEREKALLRQLDAPPLFGHRNAGGFWLDHLRLLDQGGGFERAVTLEPTFAAIRAALAGDANPWTKVVHDFALDEAPYVGASVPSKAELERRETAYKKRVEGYVADAQKRYGGDAQTAVAKFAADYDKNTAEIDAIDKRLAKPKLVPDVPLSMDPTLKLEEVEAGGVKGFRGVFDNMSFAETSVSLDLKDAANSVDLPWLAILPRFLTESGVVIDGKPVAYDKAAEMRSKEIYSLTAEYAVRPSRGRHELRVSASGASVDEASRAIEWIGLCLEHPWIDAANLPRLRDLVAQEIQATRARLGGAEEDWVEDPARAVRWQGDPLFLATSSIHARLYLLARCEWRLMDKPEGDAGVGVYKALAEMVKLSVSAADAKSTTAALDERVAQWKATGRPEAKWLVPIANRIKEMVGDMAPTTIAEDVAALVAQCMKDLDVGATGALKEIDAVRQSVVDRNGARFTLTGSRATTDALLGSVGTLIGGFAKREYVRAPRPSESPRIVDVRMADHEAPGAKPVHYALVNDAGTTGVFVNTAKAGGLDDLDERTLTAELAGRVFGGGGPHGFFMKTWGAGLAYSNGLGMNPAEGRVSYYAERCPDLVQTMSFVTGLVKDAQALDDPYLAEYCVAGAVTANRQSDEYETRTRAAADDMVDGDTPERVARYRKAVLALRNSVGLWILMKPNIVAMTGRVLPGVGPNSRDVADGNFFVIAPAPMLDKWEKYVKEHEGKDERVFRIYGRDFWMVP